jgi:Domain of unknown function (DUF4349)
MIRKLLLLCLAAPLFLAFGCEKKMVAPPPSPVDQVPISSGPALSRASAAKVSLTSAPQRFIVERHKLQILTSASQLQKSWDSTVAFCGTMQCEVTSSSITTQANGPFPTGSISMRVAPQDLQKLIDYVGKLGKISQHTTERQDVTTQVVDTDARIKNLTAFRDNLRAMLSKPSATVKDLIEIQQQLTETQSELDSETSQRKILASEIDKIAVQIDFYVQTPATGSFSAIKEAFGEAGSDLADSTAALISFVVTIIPWLILIIPAIWLFVRLWRKFRRKRATLPPPSTQSP